MYIYKSRERATPPAIFGNLASWCHYLAAAMRPVGFRKGIGS